MRAFLIFEVEKLKWCYKIVLKGFFVFNFICFGLVVCRWRPCGNLKWIRWYWPVKWRMTQDFMAPRRGYSSWKTNSIREKTSWPSVLVHVKIIWLFINHLRSVIFRGDVFSYYKWLNVHVSSLKIYLISSKNMPCMVYSLCIFNFCIVYAKGFELFIENLTYTNSLHYFAQFFPKIGITEFVHTLK